MANRAPLPYPVFQAFDASGDPLSGGTVTFYDAGTSTKRDIYSDPELTTTLPNPVTLNSRGEPESGGGSATNIYLDDSPYKIVLKDSEGATIRTVDNHIWAPLQAPLVSTDPSLAFDTWRTPNADRTVFVMIAILVQTDGTSDAEVELQLDESGDEVSDYEFRVVAEADLFTGATSVGQLSAIIPPGGAYRISNVSDPDNANTIQDSREYIL